VLLGAPSVCSTERPYPKSPIFPDSRLARGASLFHFGALPAQAERLVKIAGWFLEINFLDEVVLADRKRLARYLRIRPFLPDKQGARDGP
jgi:hypothetical protein